MQKLDEDSIIQSEVTHYHHQILFKSSVRHYHPNQPSKDEDDEQQQQSSMALFLENKCKSLMRMQQFKVK